VFAEKACPRLPVLAPRVRRGEIAAVEIEPSAVERAQLGVENGVDLRSKE